MSEYIEIEALPGADPDEIILTTNIKLTSASHMSETYRSPAEMEEGSPLAQALSYIEGIRQLHISAQTMTIRRDPQVDWHIVIADVSAAVRDFFL